MVTSKAQIFALCIALTFSGLGLTACDNEVKGNKAGVADPATPTEEVAKTPEEAPVVEEVKEEPAVEVTEVAVNKETSKIEFMGAKITGTHSGGFKEFDGKLMLTADGSLNGVMFTVNTNSVYSDNDKLTEHLKSPDFFDTAKFSEAKFESTSITAGSDVKTEDDKPYTHTIKGNMTLHGIVKELTFPVMVDTSGDKVVANTNFVFDRNVFEITYAGKADDLIKPEVKMIISLEAPKS